ncbi:MAG: hypothetical protein MK098_09850 [Marinovum sp.]|nr:hypothetical protein [Marinovum sp.]
MTKRFANLTKIPEQPASRLLAAGNAKLREKINAPASASVEVVLTELESKEAWIDMVRLMSVALPPRECVWWACLAGRQILGAKGQSVCLDAAEAWVFDPSDANRIRVQEVLENEASGDLTAPAATAALYAPGNLGPGNLAEHPAPPGIVGACGFGINLRTLKVVDDLDVQFHLIIDRALDIARGGNGQVKPRAPLKEAGDA